MGTASSRKETKEQIRKLLKQGTEIKSKAADTIENVSPWFLTGGVINVPDREQVNSDLQKKLHKEGPGSIQIATFSLWRLFKDALLTDKVKKTTKDH